MAQLSVIIPVFNEAGNLAPLCEELALSLHPGSGVEEVIWVDNGSTDASSRELATLASRYPWCRVLRLDANCGYGGGVRAGVAAASLRSTHIGWIPADGQVSIKDVLTVWDRCRQNPSEVHKGLRARREDSLSQRLVSKTYSLLARILLRLHVQDINALPKIFPAKLLRRSCSSPHETTGFAFDAEMLLRAHEANIRINEHPVVFHSRRSGKSTWSRLRIRTYLDVTRSLLQLRHQQSPPLKKAITTAYQSD